MPKVSTKKPTPSEFEPCVSARMAGINGDDGREFESWKLEE